MFFEEMHVILLIKSWLLLRKLSRKVGVVHIVEISFFCILAHMYDILHHEKLLLSVIESLLITLFVVFSSVHNHIPVGLKKVMNIKVVICMENV